MRATPFFLNDDARILDLIRKGDEEALALLYHANRAPIEAFVKHNSGNVADAEDLLQDALIVLWERVRTGRYKHEAKIGTFLYATARNMWLRRLSRLRREVAEEFQTEEPPSNDATALEVMIEEEETATVRKALDLLGEPCKKLLLLFYWEEHSMEQIALELGFANAETAKSKKYQCKKSLQGLIEEMRSE